jgi:hypothetical protein
MGVADKHSEGGGKSHWTKYCRSYWCDIVGCGQVLVPLVAVPLLKVSVEVLYWSCPSGGISSDGASKNTARHDTMPPLIWPWVCWWWYRWGGWGSIIAMILLPVVPCMVVLSSVGPVGVLTVTVTPRPGDTVLLFTSCGLVVGYRW